MSTNRSKDRSSLSSFTFVDGPPLPHSPPRRPNSLPITCHLIPHRRARPLLPRRHRAHLLPPNRAEFIPH